MNKRFREQIVALWENTPDEVVAYVNRGGWEVWLSPVSHRYLNAIAGVSDDPKRITYYEYSRDEKGLYPSQIGEETHYHELGHVMRAQSSRPPERQGFYTPDVETTCGTEGYLRAFMQEHTRLTPQQINAHEYYLSTTFEQKADSKYTSGADYTGITRAMEETYAELFSEQVVGGEMPISRLMPRTAGVVARDIARILPCLSRPAPLHMPVRQPLQAGLRSRHLRRLTI